MKYGAALGWGITIYAIMFLVWNGFVLHGFVEGVWPRVASALVLIVVATIAGRSLKFNSMKDILPYSLSWVVIVALLDAFYSVPYSGWQLYSNLNVWIGYALVCAVPLLAPYTRAARHSSDA